MGEGSDSIQDYRKRAADLRAEAKTINNGYT